jgi:F-type H+-transporting ATPase subunit b
MPSVPELFSCHVCETKRTFVGAGLRGEPSPAGPRRTIAAGGFAALALVVAITAGLIVASSPTVAGQPARVESAAAGGAGEARPARPGTQATQAGEQERHGGGLLDTVARLVNFAIFAGTLVYLLRLPIRDYLAERRARIHADLVDAAEMRRAAAAQIEEIERRVAALPGELDALRARSVEEIVAEETRIRAAAAVDRDRLLDHARREIEQRVKVAERGLVKHAAELAVGIASDRIKKTMTAEDQKRLVDQYVQILRS